MPLVHCPCGRVLIVYMFLKAAATLFKIAPVYTTSHSVVATRQLCAESTLVVHFPPVDRDDRTGFPP